MFSIVFVAICLLITTSVFASDVYIGYYATDYDQYYIDRWDWDGADGFTILDEKFTMIDLNRSTAFQSTMMSFGADGYLYIGYYATDYDQYYIDRWEWDGGDGFTILDEKFTMIDLNRSTAFQSTMMSFGADGYLYIGYYATDYDQYYIDRWEWDGGDGFTILDEKFTMIDLNRSTAFQSTMMSFGADGYLYIGYYATNYDEYYIDRWEWDGADGFTILDEKFTMIDLNRSTAFQSTMMSFEVQPVPEPATIILMALSALSIYFRKKK